MHHKTIHQFTTASEDCAEAIRILFANPRSRELLAHFNRLKSPKRRNTLLRMARYLADGQNTCGEPYHAAR